MTTFETRIAEVLSEHLAKTMCSEGDGFYVECRCGRIGHIESDAEDWEPANQWVCAHQAAMLAPLIEELVQAEIYSRTAANPYVTSIQTTMKRIRERRSNTL